MRTRVTVTEFTLATATSYDEILEARAEAIGASVDDGYSEICRIIADSNEEVEAVCSLLDSMSIDFKKTIYDTAIRIDYCSGSMEWKDADDRTIFAHECGHRDRI